MKNNKETILIISIVFIGCLIRILGLSFLPNALNVDEVSSAYESYSIANYGVDRNGNSYPVFLEAWGGGQNALLSYLAVPFVKIFGLNVISIRLPMAIISSLSLIVFYLLLKRLTNKSVAIIGLMFLAICPWHIMKSRWGLESNLFPDLILFFTYFLVKGLQDKKKALFYVSFVLAGLSSYAYGTSYMFLPLFIIPTLIVLKVKKEITIKEIVISLLITAIVSLPMILFVIINTFNLSSINLLGFTIPKLTANRFKLITSIFSNNFLSFTWNNIKGTAKVLVFQTDGYYWNSFKNFGTIYLFSSIFTIIGLITPTLNKLVKNKKDQKIIVTRSEETNLNWIFALWLIASLIIGIVCDPNINRLNILMFPIIYYTVLGIYEFTKYKQLYSSCLLVIYLIYFSLFAGKYLGNDWNYYFTFESGLSEVFDYINELDSQNDNLYFAITDKIKEPYIYTLFYTKSSPVRFHETVKYVEGTENLEYRAVKSFNNYSFDVNDPFLEDKNVVYVFKKNDEVYVDLEEYDTKIITDYLIIIPKNPQLTQ